jgi:hypothetical protein
VGFFSRRATAHCMVQVAGHALYQDRRLCRLEVINKYGLSGMSINNFSNRAPSLSFCTFQR